MNYKRIYDALVKRGQERESLDGYKEKHHIIPKCMKGTDKKENLVELTAREHYIAHALLCKIYPKETGVWYAFGCMCSRWGNGKNPNGRNYHVNSYLYEWCKINYAKAVSKVNIGKPAWNKGLKGVCSLWNEEQRKEISERNKGAGNGMFGRKQSDKCREVNSRIHKGRKYPPEICLKGKKRGKEHPRYGKHWGPDFAYKSAISKCYKQLLRYNSLLIDETVWDNYKLSKPTYNVSKDTIIKHFGSFENMIAIVNEKYKTTFVSV